MTGRKGRRAIPPEHESRGVRVLGRSTNTCQDTTDMEAQARPPQPPSAGLWALSLSPTVAFLRALEGHQQTLAEHLWAIPQGTILNFQLAQ